MLLGINSDFEPVSSTGTYNSLATVVAAGVSSQVIDLGGPAIGGSQGRDLGPGANANGPFLVVALNGVTTSSSLTALQFKLQGAPDNGSGAPGTYVDYLLSPAYTQAELTATQGEQFYFPIIIPPRPPGVAPPRFLQLAYVPSGTGSITAGTIYAGLSTGRDDNASYQSGFAPPPTVGAGS